MFGRRPTMEFRTLAKMLSLLMMMAFLLFSGCNDKTDILLFHSGVGQRSSLNEIKELFIKRNPGVKVDFAYKGSGYFIADISRSHEGDLYMPGEEFYLLQALERGFIEDYDPDRDIAAYFITCIITPRGNPANVRCIEDFSKPGIRVGLGNPKACAIGIWHEKTFKKAGIWHEVQENARFSAKCIPELGNAVQHRLIDATIVWSSTAVLYLRDIEIIPIEPKFRGAIRLPVALLRFSRNRETSQKLKNLILSDEGKEIFLSHAYATGMIPTDEHGFVADEGKTTDRLMTWLVNATRAVEDESSISDANHVGPLIKEVIRQRKTIRAGN
jgi:molybdate transport system substrate-binding protein